MRLLTLVAAVALAGCVTRPTVSVGIPDCGRYVPPSMKARVPGVDLPTPSQHSDGHQDALPWQEGFLGQTGQVEKANDRGDGIEHIYATCLALHAEAERRSTKGFFGRLFD